MTNYIFFVLVACYCLGFTKPLVAATNYVGSQQCADCHSEQYAQWQNSHHFHAMEVANEQTVLGDFANTSFTHNGITSTFFRKDKAFWVKTDGPTGSLQEYKISYTFGYYPLQQYLIRFPDGRYQVLSLCWDSRPKAAGGQRWFHLYPEEAIAHTDVLHWTRYSQNWNARCAACHSTDLAKNYDPKNNNYATGWAEINVACEACHGPAAKHIELMQQPAATTTQSQNHGFLHDLAAAGQWSRNPAAATARNSALAKNSSATNQPQLTVCGSCHARRSLISAEDHAITNEFLDRYQPRLLTADLYHADGQMQDEVYVYGSFLQSKMQQKGVVCSDCHNPHSLKLKAAGNAVCAQCHNPAVFAQSKHHKHQADSTGAQCVNCHMPATTYMVVDPRRDHSMRIPRPDLSAQLNSPNACNQCHQDKTLEWAVKQFRQWYPERVKQPQYGTVLQSARRQSADALPGLMELIADQTATEIVRATALQLLRNYPAQNSANTASNYLNNDSALMRLGAVQALEMVPENQRILFLWRKLDDPVLAVRLEAARLLANSGTLNNQLSEQQRARLNQAFAELIAALELNADEPGTQINLGVVYIGLNQIAKAEAAYQQALVLEPNYIPALLNLADLKRNQGDSKSTFAYLQQGLALEPGHADLNHAMGLWYVRAKQSEAALKYLAVAAEAAPDNLRYSLIYAVAAFDYGKPETAVNILKTKLLYYPDNQELRFTLINYLQQMGRFAEAATYQ